MSSYYKIKIGTLWLTSDGLETGKPCKITFPDAALLVNSEVGNTRIASDGTAVSEFPLTSGKGRVFSLEVLALSAAVFGSLKTLLDGLAIVSPISLEFTATGLAGNISTHVLGSFVPTVYTFQQFNALYVQKATINLVTAAAP